MQQFFDGQAVARIDGDAGADGNARLDAVLNQSFANAMRDLNGDSFLSFGKHQSEFVAAVSRGGIHAAAVITKDVGEAFERLAADQVSVVVIYFFQAVEIEKQHGKSAIGAVSALELDFHDFEQMAIVGEARQRIADGEAADLIEEARVVEKRAGQNDGVADSFEQLRGAGSRIEAHGRLAHGQMTSHICRAEKEQRASEKRIQAIRTLPKSHRGDEINGGGQ